MCYAPTKRSATLIERAQQRISEGKIDEAERLLAAAKNQMGPVLHIVWKGRRVGDLYNIALKALMQAKRDRPSTMRFGGL